MTQVRLNRPRVGGTIGQVIATGVSQLMWMHRKRDLRQLPGSLNDVSHYGLRERAAALGYEYPAAIRVLLLQFPQRIHLTPIERMRGGCAILNAGYVDGLVPIL